MNISVIGAGQMGAGIAQVFAAAGHQVSLVDISQESLARGVKSIDGSLERIVRKGSLTEAERTSTLERITTHTDLGDGVKSADLVIEAATENSELKLKIFAQLSSLAPAAAPLATNTSSISITRIAAATDRPAKVIGMHFMNPVPVMQLVEVIRGYATDDATCKMVMDLSRSLGKTPVEVNDYPGFVANRILMPMLNEAMYALWEGVGGVAEIDTVMKLGMAHPMGPLQLADYIGLDTCLAILNVMKEGFGRAHYQACPLLVNMVTAGKLGRKSGEGFYNYSGGGKDLVVSAAFQ
ncbi:3-hydroxybutyryl-CoA dehydrogenase [Neolewinella lacunae]|uniref:3-hydroxybutyryl-CoA dehydrogenase n=1 Tax=Neolewinella lacunae TaxID=1517758 RepID=A0A923PM09_9BACT|nr:3-hydroxybutyryl-CoA dehydrogenase [Neolewinella lacunae]MBC6996510.1 3-hydroxybutyryl-CoA dehydrogenase [Neolewinella lacunae]MDN3636663.1 3-hydroxybutyryl-CoA dehydrogenase [Neolewinella lacunae]